MQTTRRMSLDIKPSSGWDGCRRGLWLGGFIEFTLTTVLIERHSSFENARFLWYFLKTLITPPAEVNGWLPRSGRDTLHLVWSLFQSNFSALLVARRSASTNCTSPTILASSRSYSARSRTSRFRAANW